MPKMLVIGYGNPGRGDDGLGPALAEAIEAMNLPDVTVESDYQLTVDHTTLIAAHDMVVFADAAIGLPEPWRLSALDAEPRGTLGSHSLSPSAALQLTRLLFGKAPPCWLLAISGTWFDDVREGLSPAAQANLAHAVTSLKNWLTERSDTMNLPPEQSLSWSAPTASCRERGHGADPTTP